MKAQPFPADSHRSESSSWVPRFSLQFNRKKNRQIRHDGGMGLEIEKCGREEGEEAGDHQASHWDSAP